MRLGRKVRLCNFRSETCGSAPVAHHCLKETYQASGEAKGSFIIAPPTERKERTCLITLNSTRRIGSFVLGSKDGSRMTS